MLDHLIVAQLEEWRQARGLADIAPEYCMVAGGCAARGAPGTWINNSVGIGLNGPVDPTEIDLLVRWFEEVSIEPRVELSPYADPSALRALSARGFVIRDWENVLYRELHPSVPVIPVQTPPADLTIAVLDPSDSSAVREYAMVSMSGFLPPETMPSDAEIELAERWARHPRTVCVTGSLEGQVVGAGAASVDETIVALGGLSVLPHARRRGVQQALIAARLNIACKRGATLATIGSRPGAPTERNVRRMGFTLAYTKAIIVKPGPGLVPNAS